MKRGTALAILLCASSSLSAAQSQPQVQPPSSAPRDTAGSQPVVIDPDLKVANHPDEICGIVGLTAEEFARKVMSDSRFVLRDATDQYLLYATLDGYMEWTLSTPKFTAHPLASCRYLFEDNGRWKMTRQMRCNDTTERCNAAFVEFKIRDGKLSASNAASTSP